MDHRQPHPISLSLVDDIVTRLSQLTINNYATPQCGDASIDAAAEALNQLSMDDNINIRPPTKPHASPPGPPPTEDDLNLLIILDEWLENHMKRIILYLDALADPKEVTQKRVQLDLLKEQRQLHISLGRLKGLDNHPTEEIQVLGEAIRERLTQFSSAIDLYIEILQARSPPQTSSNIVESGTHSFYFYFLRVLRLKTYFS